MVWERFFDRYVSSHVGSLPLDFSEENVRRAFRDMVEAGVDVPPVPQLRDFISMYLGPLAEAGLLEGSGTTFRGSPEALEGAGRVAAAPRVVAERAREARVRWVRVPVTGAFTLASRIYVGDPARGLRGTALAVRELVEGPLAEYVSNIVRAAAQLRGAVVVIDEPVLGMVVGARTTLFGYRDEDVLEVYSRELRAARGLPRGTHVCGQLNERLVSILAESESLDFLNHEFHDTLANLSLPWRRLLERGDKFLSPGVFSTRRVEVESVEEIEALAAKVIEVAGAEYVNLFSGDCGLGGLRGREGAYEASLEKLRNLAAAVVRINERAGLAR